LRLVAVKKQIAVLIGSGLLKTRLQHDSLMVAIAAGAEFPGPRLLQNHYRVGLSYVLAR
jgi:hypothetical protein